jgi:hypothetical protein
MAIDAAAAPPDRDWLAGVAVATVEWWFADEPSARAAVPSSRPCGGGEVVLSGMLAHDVPGIVERFEPLVGSRPLVREQGEWRCLSFRLE